MYSYRRHLIWVNQINFQVSLVLKIDFCIGSKRFLSEMDECNLRGLFQSDFPVADFFFSHDQINVRCITELIDG